MSTSLRNEASARRRAERTRQILARQLVEAEEQERQRIARELHDQAGQLLIAIMLGVKSLESQLADSAPREALRDLAALTSRLERDLHQVACDLRPTGLDDLGLAQTLTMYAGDWATRTGISVELETSDIDDNRLPCHVETALYRVVQEALNNIFKHASARQVNVVIRRSDRRVVATIKDDGVGFDASASKAGAHDKLGIAVMQERVAVLSGLMTVDSSPGRGTRLSLHIPLPPK